MLSYLFIYLFIYFIFSNYYYLFYRTVRICEKMHVTLLDYTKSTIWQTRDQHERATETSAEICYWPMTIENVQVIDLRTATRVTGTERDDLASG